MNNLILRILRRADINNRIYLPAEAIKLFGRNYAVELYEDCIKLIPVDEI